VDIITGNVKAGDQISIDVKGDGYTFTVNG